MIERHGMGENPGFYTTTEYWDCECKKDYIHPKSKFRCMVCGYSEDDGMPDSRVLEVLDAGLPLKEMPNEEELKEIEEYRKFAFSQNNP